MIVKCGCGREYVYDSRNRKGHTKTKCNSCSVNIRRVAVKRWAVEYKGGKCFNCDYDRCLRALVFHHIDPSKKDLEINGATASRSRKILQAELDKCVLLCSNCHMEEHERFDQPPKALR